MKEFSKGSQQPGEMSETTESQLANTCPDQLRRDFLKRFGSYTAGATVGLYVLMSAKTSKAAGSDGAP